MCLLCIMFQLLGCIVIGYMAWVLATSVTVSKFIDGSMVGTNIHLYAAGWVSFGLQSSWLAERIAAKNLC